MIKVCLVLVALIACASCVPIKVQKAGSDVPCDLCLQIMDEGLSILLNEILNGGVVGGCDYLCHKLPDKVLDIGCNILCDVVGLKEFVKIINNTDPDPIWYCQELKSCPKVDGGVVTLNSCTVSPPSGPVGTNFTVTTVYTVVNATGPGFMTIEIVGGGLQPIEDSQVSYGQIPGQYELEWDVQTDSNFTSGSYAVSMAICEGDCQNKHPYSGIYAKANTNFTITGN